MEEIIKIGIIGDYEENRVSHQATNEAIRHCSEHLCLQTQTTWLPTPELEGDLSALRSGYDAFWCAPGSPYQSFSGAIRAIQYIREGDAPFLGTCGGFQHAVMEYAMHVLGMEHVAHEELHGREERSEASGFFIQPLSCSLIGETKTIYLKRDSMIYHIYEKADCIEEKYNCNFGLNPVYQDTLQCNGFHVAGVDEQGEVRIFELSGKAFYIATLFQPQLGSTEQAPHKLILRYLEEAAKNHRKINQAGIFS